MGAGLRSTAPGVTRRVVTTLTVLAALAFGTAAPAQEATPGQLLKALQQGGLVIFMRHGETGPAVSDRERAVIGDCSTQRNLDATGRAQVAAMGQAFKALKIPVGQVLSSEFCRCWQHAEAMFGKGNYSLSPALTVAASYPAVTPADRALNNTRLNALLSQRPPTGSNTVLVSHGNNVLLATGYHPDVQGEAVLFRPDGRGGYARLGSLLPDDWTRLAQAAGR